MRQMRFAAQFVIAWIVLMLAHMLAGMVIPIHAPVVPGVFLWFGVSEALVVLVLLPALLRAPWKGWKLLLALWTIPTVISITNMIEGVVFLSRLSIDWRGLVLNTMLSYAIAIAAWALLFRHGMVPDLNEAAFVDGNHVFRNLALGAAVYTTCYLIAGTLVFPYVRDFYATQYVPPLWSISAQQLFIRGPIFVALCQLLARMYRLPYTLSILAVGIGWAILNGVAPLLIPNPYFPEYVRWGHFVEVSSSNLVFGAFCGWLWGRSKASAVPVAAAA